MKVDVQNNSMDPKSDPNINKFYFLLGFFLTFFLILSIVLFRLVYSIDLPSFVNGLSMGFAGIAQFLGYSIDINKSKSPPWEFMGFIASNALIFLFIMALSWLNGRFIRMVYRTTYRYVYVR